MALTFRVPTLHVVAVTLVVAEMVLQPRSTKLSVGTTAVAIVILLVTVGLKLLMTLLETDGLKDGANVLFARTVVVGLKEFWTFAWTFAYMLFVIVFCE